MKRLALSIAALAVIAAAACAADAPAKGQWVNISDPLVAKLAAEGKKPGYAGPTAGIAVDRANGDVFLVINDQGLFRSGDQGATWARCDGGAVTGRCETGFGIDADPAGGRIAMFVVYGSSAVTLDGGKAWAKSKLSHIDAVAADWPDGKTLLALRHESGGTLALSTDGGAAWKDIGKGFKGVGVFDAKTYIATKDKEPGIFRSTDGGETWKNVSDLQPAGLAMRIHKGVGYWTSDRGLIGSRDKGTTWSVIGTPVRAMAGPFFGKDDSHVVVVGRDGFTESTDGGKSWKVAAPLPPEYTADRMMTAAWDAVRNIFYASRMTKPAYKFER